MMWLGQPQFPAPLDKSNPLASGLQFCFDGRSRYDAVSGRLLTPANPSFINEGLAAHVADSATVPQLSGRTFTPGTGLTFFIMLRHGAAQSAWVSLLGRGSDSDSTSSALQFDDTNGMRFWSKANGSSWFIGTFQSAGVHSYACTASGSTISGYVDGLFAASDTYSHYIDSAANTWFVGATAADWLSENVIGDYLFAAAWNRPLTAIEIANMHGNPWSVFGPPRSVVINLPVRGAAVQLLSPASDVSSGGWTPSTGSDLFAMVDETSYSDTDYIVSSTASACTLAFAAGSDPAVSTGHILRYRLLSGSGSVSAVLKQGTSTIASFGPHTLSGAAQDFAQTLTGGQADSITDYSALRVEFTAS